MLRAARQVLFLVSEEDPPPDEARLLVALYRLRAGLRDAQGADPSELPDHPDPPEGSYARLFDRLGARFAQPGVYPDPLPGEEGRSEPPLADAIDDLTDICLDLAQVIWLADEIGPAAAQAHALHLSFHWGAHADRLSRHLSSRLA